MINSPLEISDEFSTVKIVGIHEFNIVQTQIKTQTKVLYKQQYHTFFKYFY